MKLPARLRQLTRATLGLRGVASISPSALHQLAATEDVLVLSVGVVARGAIDERLPGEQRTASLTALAAAVADVPRGRAIVTHCG
ncbi:MAG: hypothetical protein M3680_17210 [Myxococcota bacterium]|nr:hypothetical protein [Myxococcota bacterium]